MNILIQHPTSAPVPARGRANELSAYFLYIRKRIKKQGSEQYESYRRLNSLFHRFFNDCL